MFLENKLLEVLEERGFDKFKIQNIYSFPKHRLVILSCPCTYDISTPKLYDMMHEADIKGATELYNQVNVDGFRIYIFEIPIENK